MNEQATSGPLRKMKTTLAAPVQYSFRIGEQEIPVNPLIGEKIHLHFTGHIFCIECGRKTNKSFQQGFCFPCLRRLQECNLCIIHPERCLVEEGKCPENDWAHSQCHSQQVVYLANSSGLKVGITRSTQVPTRWMDQGAMQALPIYQVQNRRQAGLVEVALKQFVADRTDWRKMLKQDSESMDLVAAREALIQQAEPVLKEIIATYPEDTIKPITDAPVVSIQYPIEHYPEKIKSLSFDKTHTVSGNLLGIKGQYLILDTGVLNIRKFGGYEVSLR